VRILQKPQENGQNRTNTDTGKEREYKSWENAIKVIKTDMAEYYITKCSYWSIPTKGMLRGLKKTHKEWGFYTKSCLKEAQSPLTHGCHVGNPCAPQSNPTMEREHPMIEGMKGQDLWEHLPTSKA
ncbi:hypothetical protein Tco_1565197, partial [Tanacetum coccineum]